MFKLVQGSKIVIILFQCTQEAATYIDYYLMASPHGSQCTTDISAPTWLPLDRLPYNAPIAQLIKVPQAAPGCCTDRTTDKSPDVQDVHYLHQRSLSVIGCSQCTAARNQPVHWEHGQEPALGSKMAAKHRIRG